MHQDEYGREIGTDLKYVMQQADWNIKYCTSVGQIYISYTSQYFPFHASRWMRKRDWNRLEACDATGRLEHKIWYTGGSHIYIYFIHYTIFSILCIKMNTEERLEVAANRNSVWLFTDCIVNLYISCTENLYIICIVNLHIICTAELLASAVLQTYTSSALYTYSSSALQIYWSSALQTYATPSA